MNDGIFNAGQNRRFNRKMKNGNDLETDSGVATAAMVLEYLPWNKLYYYAEDFVRNVFDVLLTHGTETDV